MSATLTSTRTGASRAGAAFLHSTTPKKSPAGASRQPQRPRETVPLAQEMHRRLHPHLYDENGTALRKISRAVAVPKPLPERPGHLSGFFRAKLKEHNKTRKSAPSTKNICPDPVSAVTSSQISLLDPTGARTRLFARDNPECARVGDILLVRQRTGDPFAGVCINIRRRGVDTAILLRGQLTRVGVEMWYKVYSPLVEGIEIVQRATKKARRARLTYMRKVKHDRGSVENVVRMYLRQKAALGTAEGQKKKGAAAAAAMAGGKKGPKRGKKR